MTGIGDTTKSGAILWRWPDTLVVAMAFVPVIAFLIEPNLTSFTLPPAALIAAIALVRAGPEAIHLIARSAWPVIAAAMFLCWIAFSLHWAPDGSGDISRVTKIGGVLLCATLLASAPGRWWARPVVVGLGLGFAVLALVLVEASTLGWFRDVLTADDDPRNWYNWEKRPSALLAVFLFPILLGLARLGRPVLFWGAGLLFCAAIVTSGYAAAILALAVGGLCVAAGRFAPRSTAAILLSGAALMAFVLPVALTSAPLSPILSAVSAPSPQHRILIADFVSDAISERPYLGWGLDASKAIPEGAALIAETPSRAERVDPTLLAPGVREVGQNLPLHPHNVVLQVRLELGGIGAALFLLCLGVVLGRLARSSDPWDRAVGLGQAGAILAVWMVSFGAWQTWWLAAVALSIGAAVCARRAAPEEAKAEARKAAKP